MEYHPGMRQGGRAVLPSTRLVRLRCLDPKMTVDAWPRR